MPSPGRVRDVDPLLWLRAAGQRGGATAGGDIDSEQMIIRIVQSKGRKDQHVMLPAEILDLLRQWWKARPTRHDTGVAPEQRWLFPGRGDHQPMTTRQFGRLFKQAAKAFERRPRRTSRRVRAKGRRPKPFT